MVTFLADSAVIALPTTLGAVERLGALCAVHLPLYSYKDYKQKSCLFGIFGIVDLVLVAMLWVLHILGGA